MEDDDSVEVSLDTGAAAVNADPSNLTANIDASINEPSPTPMSGKKKL